MGRVSRAGDAAAGTCQERRRVLKCITAEYREGYSRIMGTSCTLTQQSMLSRRPTQRYGWSACSMNRLRPAGTYFTGGADPLSARTVHGQAVGRTDLLLAAWCTAECAIGCSVSFGRGTSGPRSALDLDDRFRVGKR